MQLNAVGIDLSVYLYLIIKLSSFTCQKQEMSKNKKTSLLLQLFWMILLLGGTII